MQLKKQLYNMGAKLVLERPANSRGLKEFEEMFVQSGQALISKYAAAEDDDHTRRVISHVIGIERWGQRRLQVALGDPFVKDEYDIYRPPRDSTLESLQVAFDNTRATTIDLIRQMQEALVDLTMQIEHNHYGPLTVRGWLQYLHVHSTFESERLKD